MTSNPHQVENEKFVAALERLLSDRGAVASLRKWWSATARHYAYPILGRLRALEDDRRTILAALFAVHATGGRSPHSSGGSSLGTAALRLAGGSKGAGFESMERHFQRLLAAKSLEDLSAQLVRLVKRLERDSIPLDYVQLLTDLRQFHTIPEKVRIRWSRDFWHVEEQDTPDAVQA